ncbi:NAD-dependent epimerase/dehydratase family protein [Herminiimonas arsenitoxidans]|uniref:NAD-dependent epimerase/dehydratase family protein n=1 Tax=Herminiimonas arsenitoxidans TaxID=1809410 RepID=UPI00097144B1|nr:NAD(P)-dependent oxidoreductase [Herminiimonas arsenitoxidans]
MNTVVVVGASGYIGRHLVAELTSFANVRIKILTRSFQEDEAKKNYSNDVELIEGDLCDPASLNTLFEPGCTVIHLAYLGGAGESKNLAATLNLTNACRAANVNRLIHLSTAMVSGRAVKSTVSEEDLCFPITDYAVTKLKVEQMIIAAAQGNFQTVILRPTAVFGQNGENLKKLTNDLLAGRRVRNYLKSCLFGKRRMNLVHISNVVAAIVFLQKSSDTFDGQVFMVSDADAALNNFRDVECILMRELNIPDYRFPRLQLPLFILSGVLTLMGKDNTNPQCDYVSQKLARLGYEKAIEFESGLIEYAASYRLPSDSH